MATPTFPHANTPVQVGYPTRIWLFVSRQYVVPEILRIPMFPWSISYGSRVSPIYRSLGFSEDKENKIAVGGSHEPQYLTHPIKLNWAFSLPFLICFERNHMYSNGILHWRLAEQLTRVYCHRNGIGKRGVEIDIIRFASLNNSTLLSSIVFYRPKSK